MKQQIYLFLALFSWHTVCKPWFEKEETLLDKIKKTALETTMTTYQLPFDNFITVTLNHQPWKNEKSRQEGLKDLQRQYDKYSPALANLFWGVIALEATIKAINAAVSLVAPQETARHFTTLTSSTTMVPNTAFFLLLTNALLSKIALIIAK